MSEPRAQQDRFFETTHLGGDLRGRTIRGGLVMLTAQGARFALEMLRIAILARLLAPADFGLVAMVVAVTNFIGTFRDLGLGTPTVTRSVITHVQVSTLFWLNAALSVLLMCAAVGLAPLLAWFYDEPRTLAIALALAPVFLLSGLTVQHQAILQRKMRFQALSAINVASIAVGVVVAIALARSGAGYWSLVAMHVASAAVVALGVWLAAGWRPGLPARRSGVGGMVRFGGHLAGSNVVNYFGQLLDHALIGWRWGVVPLGLYSKAQGLAVQPINRVLSPIGSVIVPALTQVRSDPERYRAAYCRALARIALVALPAGAFLIGTSSWIVPLVLGPGWDGAVPIFAVLSLAWLVRPVSATSWWLLLTQERARHAFRWTCVHTALDCVAIGVGLGWGALGVASGLAVSGLVQLPMLFWYVGRRGPVQGVHVWRAVAAPTAAAIGALAALAVYRAAAPAASPVLHLATAGVLTALVALAVLGALPAGRRLLGDSRGDVLAGIRTLKLRSTGPS